MPRKVVKMTPQPCPLPYDMEDDTPKTFLDDLETTANTSELLDHLGSDAHLPEIENAEADEMAIKDLLERAVLKRDTSALHSHAGAMAAASFLREYGSAMALDVVQVRTALTTKLITLADSVDPKVALKAIELLGKHSDIGLFTERSEININYNSPEALENAIKDRVKRLLNAQIEDHVPLSARLEEIYGVEPLDADYADYNEVAAGATGGADQRGGDLSDEAEDGEPGVDPR